MLIGTFILNVINTERKNLTHHEIIDQIAEQIMSVRNESKLRIHPYLRRSNFSFNYSSMFTYFCIV